MMQVYCHFLYSWAQFQQYGAKSVYFFLVQIHAQMINVEAYVKMQTPMPNR